MQAGLDKLLDLKERLGDIGLRYAGRVFNLDMIRTIELEGMIDVALAMAHGRPRPDRVPRLALPHRLHRPRRRQLAQAHPGQLRAGLAGPLGYKPVTLGTFEPQERKY